MKFKDRVEREGGLLKDVIILDIGFSIAATFMNDAFLTDIQPSDRHMTMRMNAGTKVLKQRGHLRSFGEVWYEADQAVNILGFAHLQDRFKTEYDYINDQFTVHFEAGGPIIFERCYEGLYIYKPSDKFLDWVASTKKGKETGESQPRSEDAKPRSDQEESKRVIFGENDVHYFDKYASAATRVDQEFYSKLDRESEVGDKQMVTTVEENCCAFTDRQFVLAKEPRHLHHIIGRPSIESLKALIKMNAIKNCPVEMEDVDIAVKIFGPDIGTPKGKSVRRPPNPVTENLIEIPAEHKNLTLCIDIIFVNGQPLLTAINRSIRFRLLVPL